MEIFDLTNQLLALSGILFCIGIFGFLVRKNAIMLLMSVEIMLNAVNLTLVTLAYSLQNIEAIVAVFFVIVIAAAESVVGLAIILRMYRIKQSTNTEDFALLRS